MSDAAGEKGFEQQEMDECRQNLVQIVPDANYTVPKGRLTIAHGFSRGQVGSNNQAPEGRLNGFTRRFQPSLRDLCNPERESRR